MSAIQPGAIDASELALFAPQYRAIGNIVAQVTIREEHNDLLTITRHPVEGGAAMTDHAFKEPSTVAVEIGWGALDYNAIRETYSQLLTLQSSRVPFTVYTGKRAYTNMLMPVLHTVSDDRTSNVLLVRMILQQIILVSTARYGIAPVQQNQSAPQATAPPQDQGQQQVQVPQSYNPSKAEPAMGFKIVEPTPGAQGGSGISFPQLDPPPAGAAGGL